MKRILISLAFTLLPTFLFSQAGHIMQGVGAFNMSMGGASTAQPLDISGALHWNPASISAFDESAFKLDVGIFFSAPELSSTVPLPNENSMSGVTKDDRGISPLPSLAYVYASPDSKHSFGASLFGISGFGVTFPESMTNPINMPQSSNGFGRIESEYMLMQVGFTYAYEINENLSVGIEPTFNFASLELMPNPTSNPNSSGYPSTDRTFSLGYGAQVGIYYEHNNGLKLGASYKSTQVFNDFEFDNTYLDGSEGTNKFQMDYPAIYSAGIGYSIDEWDFALDYRYVDYKNTEGFEKTGWNDYAAVNGFGWESISILSVGIQYKGIEQLPIRAGYTYSSNPISEDVAFFNIPATAIIESAFQVGFSYKLCDKIQLDAAYHHGMSDGATSGPMLNPQMKSSNNPYGAIPNTEVSYEMTTDLILLGLSYTFSK